MKKLIVLLAILTLCQVAAFADPATLSIAQLTAFTQVGSSGNTVPATTVTNSAPTGVDFTTVWPYLPTAAMGLSTADVGDLGLSLNLSGFSTFALNVLNDNENPWTFELFVTDGSVVVQSGAVSVPVGSTISLVANLTGLNLSNVTGVYVQVSGILPLGTNDDRTAEYKISPVPEPASMLLLGSGLLGLGVLTRKWRS